MTSTGDAQLINNDLSENTGAGLNIRSYDSAGLGEVNAENNGEISQISSSFVYVGNSDFSGTKNGGGLEIRSYDGEYRIEGDINIET